jgi:hypothetical protein
MKTKLSILSLLFSVSLCFSQVSFNPTGGGSGYDGETYFSPMAFKKLASKKVEGSPYLFPKELSFKTNTKLNLNGRYNALTDQIEVIRNDSVLNLRKFIGLKVTFDNDETYQVFINKSAKKTQFFNVLTKGKKVNLVAKQEVYFEPEVKPSHGYDKHHPPKFIRKKDQLFFGINKTAIEIPKKKKDFLRLFGSNGSKIKAYIKENRLSIKNTEDLKKIVAYFGTL